MFYSMVVMSNPYKHTLRRTLRYSGKTLNLFWIVKIILLIFFVVGNYQFFTNISMVFILRSLLVTDTFIILLALMNTFWSFLHFKNKLIIFLHILLNIFYLIVCFVTIFSSLFLLAVMTGT